jgi:uncharacterized protein (DUF58 family)
MTPTRRGVAVVVLVVGAVAMAVAFGARSLNALVVPGVVALAAAVVQLRLLDRPRLRRTPPTDDFQGETGEVALRFETDDPFVGSVTERVTVGGNGRTRTVETTVGAGPVTVPVSFEARGEGTVGPTEVRARDVLGLLETTITYTDTDSFLVYPRVRPLSDTAWRDLTALREDAHAPEREEFDSLRQYVRGDALRDIHWKSSAKRDDLIVKEFVADDADDAVVLAAGGDREAADLLAEATASIAVALSAAGVPVHLHLPDAEVDPGLGGDHRTRLLVALARTTGGPRPDVPADVVVEASGDGARVVVGTTETTFAALTGERPGGADADVAATARDAETRPGAVATDGGDSR